MSARVADNEGFWGIATMRGNPTLPGWLGTDPQLRQEIARVRAQIATLRADIQEFESITALPVPDEPPKHHVWY